jgi:hypothetical protein
MTKKTNAIVEEMVTAMGGMKIMMLPILSNDFVNRKLLWNKWTGDVRIENPSANQVILVNINTLKGKVYENGTLVQDETKVNGLLEKGRHCGLMIPIG